MAEYDTVYDSRNYRVVIRNIVMDSLIESSGILEQAEGSGAYMYAFILHDETELRDYIRKYQDEAMVCGLIYLDNYDEALESVEEVRRSLLTALIDRKISKYFQDLDGLVRKFENDKYVLVMRRNTLEEIKNRRFDILEDVKTVNIGNDMSVTLSIGIGVNNGSYNRNMDCARMAIDLALGRGGDQVVLKDGDSISYYGGKTQAVEKSTRVKARVKAHALKEFIDSKEKVVVMGHKLIDVDAFGGGRFGKPRHGHNVTRENYNEACACTDADVLYGHGKARGRAELRLIVGEGILRFRDADGCVTEAESL